jgi:hypothetical protein
MFAQCREPHGASINPVCESIGIMGRFVVAEMDFS